LLANELPVTDTTFRVLTDAMPQMVWSTLPDGSHDYYNDRWYEFTGVPKGSTDGDGWAGVFHPEDQPEAWRRWRHSLETGEPYEVEYRLRHHTGKYRWTIGRAQPVRNVTGAIVRWIGTCTDIHDAKTVGETNELLSHELSHRIKNIFSVIGSLIALSAKEHPDAKTFALKFRERVSALGRAHELVRPHSEDSRPSVGRTTIKGLLESLFSPYPALAEGRLSMAGEDTVIDDRGATPLALLFHELATNSIKYGSLSAPTGRVEITLINSGNSVRIRWVETGGPEITTQPCRIGFGTKLAEMSVGRQLAGKLTREWRPEGLIVEVAIEVNRLTRGERE